MAVFENALIRCETENTDAAAQDFVRLLIEHGARDDVPTDAIERVAAALLRQGARVEWISERTYDTRSADALQSFGSRTARGDLGKLEIEPYGARAPGVFSWRFERDDGFETRGADGIRRLWDLIRPSLAPAPAEKAQPNAAALQMRAEGNAALVEQRQRDARRLELPRLVDNASGSADLRALIVEADRIGVALTAKQRERVQILERDEGFAARLAECRRKETEAEGARKRLRGRKRKLWDAFMTAGVLRGMTGAMCLQAAHDHGICEGKDPPMRAQN